MKKIAVVIAGILTLACLVFVTGCSSDETKVSSYNIECSLEDNVLTGKEEVTFYNSTDTVIDELKFNLFGNAFRQNAKYSPISAQYYNAYYNGVSYGEMVIGEVSCEDKKLDFSVAGIDKNILVVSLESELYPGEKVTVTISFTLTLANVIARTGINNLTINLANFYPILCGIDDNGFYECVYYASGDPYYSDVANYTVVFSVSSEYIVAHAGKEVSSENKNGKTIYTYSLNNARSFNMVLSKHFKKVTDNSLGIDINYYYYNDSNPQASLDYAVKSVKTFSDKFGSYPYDVYSVVETRFMQGGMEFPTLVMISDSLSGASYHEVIVHETAHQWWQTTVGNNEILYPFLDEGLAEYSVVIFYEQNSGLGYSRDVLINSALRTYQTYCTVYDKLFSNIDTSMLRALNEYNGEYEYVNIAYVKGCLMFEYLRQTIGDERFFNGLQKYYSDYSFKNAEPQDLVGVYEKCGADSNGFFESFFNGKVIL